LLAQNIAGNQVQPALAARADGGFVAVWAGQDGSGYGIQIREFTPSEAAPVFTAQSVGVQAGESLLAATLLHPGHAQGEAWATSGLQRIIQYEFIDTNASAASGHFELNGVVQASGQTISVTADQLGTLRFVGGSAAASDAILVRVSDGVRWSDWDIATTQTFAPATSFVSGQERAVNPTVVNDQLLPSVTVLANGTQVVTWASNGQDGSGYGVYARLLDGHGQPLGNEFRVNASTDKSQSNPKVTGLGNGGFMIVWDEVDAVSQPPIGNFAVYARFYDAAGNAVGSEWKQALSYAASSEAAQLADGSAVMVWLQHGTVWAQRF
ncbi:hypothetical protein, partial [Azospirillum himalayense]